MPKEVSLGTHDVRIVSKSGLSNPRAFVVGEMTEVNESEPNNDVGQAQKIELNTTEEVKVRRLTPPDQFDEKGRVKRYTAKELKELKGKDKEPGFPAEFADLVSEQYITVTLVRKKDAPRVSKPRVRGKDSDVDLLSDNLPQASMILIVREPK